MDNCKRFNGKIAFITGGTKGIGKATALRLAREGADVVVGYFRSRTDADSMVKEIESHGVRGLAIRGNVGNEEHMKRMFATVEQEMGGLDIFVSNAAAGALKPAIDLTTHEWEVSMNIIARALLVGAQLAVPMMEKRGGGKIVALSSIGSVRSLQEYSAVGTAKAALESMARYLAVELAPKNINVNTVAGGITDTYSLSKFPSRDEMIAHALKYSPTGKLTDPEDVAAVVCFLLSDDARWVMGQTIMCDGGHSLVG